MLVLLAAFLSPPGRALVGSVRDAVTPNETTPKPKPALTALPAGGALLVNSVKGPWIVQPMADNDEGYVCSPSPVKLKQDKPKNRVVCRVG